MIALVFAIVAAIVQPRSATCPVGSYVGTVRPDGAYRCELAPAADVCNTKRGCDDDSPPVVVARGVLWCWPEQPFAIDERRVGCRRRRKTNYRSELHVRTAAEQRRATLAKEGVCINGRSHGPRTHGVRCRACWIVHRGGDHQSRSRKTPRDVEDAILTHLATGASRRSTARLFRVCATTVTQIVRRRSA